MRTLKHLEVNPLPTLVILLKTIFLVHGAGTMSTSVITGLQKLDNWPEDYPNAAWYSDDKTARAHFDYVGEGKANRNVKLTWTKLIQKIYGKNDLLEGMHDYIQQIFPEYSRGLKASAQPFTRECKELPIFQKHLQSRMLISLEMMASFYGAKVKGETFRYPNKIDLKPLEGEVRYEPIHKVEDFGARRQNFIDNGHNALRTTRILKSLSLVGLPQYQKGLLLFMLENGYYKVQSGRSLKYWIKTFPRTGRLTGSGQQLVGDKMMAAIGVELDASVRKIVSILKMSDYGSTRTIIHEQGHKTQRQEFENVRIMEPAQTWKDFERPTAAPTKSTPPQSQPNGQAAFHNVSYNKCKPLENATQSQHLQQISDRTYNPVKNLREYQTLIRDLGQYLDQNYKPEEKEKVEQHVQENHNDKLPPYKLIMPPPGRKRLNMEETQSPAPENSPARENGHDKSTRNACYRYGATADGESLYHTLIAKLGALYAHNWHSLLEDGLTADEIAEGCLHQITSDVHIKVMFGDTRRLDQAKKATNSALSKLLLSKQQAIAIDELSAMVCDEVRRSLPPG